MTSPDPASFRAMCVVFLLALAALLVAVTILGALP